MIHTTLLWGSDTWALTTNHYGKLEVLQNKHIRCINHMTLFDCKDYQRLQDPDTKTLQKPRTLCEKGKVETPDDKTRKTPVIE
jgi:hypothetical protein